MRIVTTTAELTAMFHPLRGTVLDLLLERPASVNELAAALDRPPSTVAYHVGVLADADLVRVVRTRRRRAIEERFWGRTARIFYVGAIGPDQLVHVPNLLTVAAAESARAHEADDLRAVLRHAHLSPEQAAAFWQRALELVDEFSNLPASSESAHALTIGLFPTDHPRLPDDDSSAA